MKYISKVAKGLSEVVKTTYEVAKLVPELAVTVAKDPRTAPMVGLVALYFVANGCATVQRRPTAKACQVAAQTENYVERTIPGIETMLKDGKIDLNEFNNLLKGQEYLAETGKTLDGELTAAKERKDETATGALNDVKEEHAQASAIVDNLVNVIKDNGKTKAYIGFNLTSGKGLKPKAWDRYTVEVPYKEAAEKFGNPAEWTKVPVNILSYFADKIEDKVAREAINYFLKNGGIDPSSVHVKTKFLGAELSEEESNAAKESVNSFKEKYMKEKEKEQEKGKTEKKPAEKEEKKKEKEL